MFLKKTLSRAVLFFSALGFSAAPAGTEGPHVRAEFFSDVRSVRPGEKFWTAVRLRMDRGWHTYWKYPGDSGMPTRLRWTLPPGLTAGDVRWPCPIKFTASSLVSYGYKDEVWLLVPLEAAAALPEGRVPLEVRVDWLECADICVPGRADLRLELPVQNAPSDKDASLMKSFALALGRLPAELSPEKVTVTEGPRDVHVRLSLPEPPPGTPAPVFYPATAEKLSEPRIRRERDAVILRFAKKTPSEPVPAVAGVLVFVPEGEAPPRGFEFQKKLEQAAPRRR